MTINHLLIAACLTFCISNAEAQTISGLGGLDCKTDGRGIECGVPKQLQPVLVDRSWHVLAVTTGGTINLLKNLTKHEADFTCDRMMGRPATKAEKAAAKKAAEEEAKREAAEKARDDAIVRSKAPRCPAMLTKQSVDLDTAIGSAAAWFETHSKEITIKLPNGQEEGACILPDGSIQKIWENLFGSNFSGMNWGEAGDTYNSSMKSCEVFR